MSIQNERKISEQTISFKQLTLNDNNNNKININNKENISNNGKNINRNNFFYNKYPKCGNIFDDKENVYNNYYLYEENILKKNKKEEEKINQEELNNNMQNGISLSNKKNKVFKRKLTRNNKSSFNSSSKLRNPLNLNRINEDISKNNNKNNNNQIYHHLSINNNSNNYNYSNYINEKQKPNRNYSYKDICIDIKKKNENNNSRNFNKNKSKSKKIKYNIDYIYENSNSDDIIEKSNIKNKKKIDVDKINILLNTINADNINEAIKKVNNLIKYEQYINELKQLYKENNNYYEKIINNDLIWLSNIIKNYKRNESYKKYCKNIMSKHKIDNFEDFKKFINNIFTKNKKNKGFIVEVKNILCKDDICYSNKENFKKIKYEPIRKFIKTEHSTLLNKSNNSNDINYTQKNVNNTMKNNNKNTYY